MGEPKENPGSEPDPGDESAGTFDPAQYKKRFEEAVANAQYMMAYAASNCPKDIKPGTIKKLINARHRIENKQKVGAKEESDFWLAYQDLWKLVQPATAESIKANLPMEGASTSKARATVNRYIVFTVIVLILLLILQIYWVIGNQLTTQSAELLQKEADLSLQINENEKDLRAIEIRYEQNEKASENFTGMYTYKDSPEWERDALEKVYTKARLETDLESLKSQLERSLKVLTAWSDPWNFLISPEKGQPEHSAKYAPLFENIDEKVKENNKQLADDPTGAKAALSQNEPLNTQRANIKKQLDDLQSVVDNLDPQQQKIQELMDEIAGIQGKINDLITEYNTATDERKRQIEIEYNELDKKVIGLDGQEIDLSVISSDDLNAMNNDLSDKLAALETNKAGIQDQIKNLQDQDQGLENQLVLAENIVSQWKQAGDKLEKDRETLVSQEQADASREISREALLAAQFVLVILQSYLLPLLYGILGASTSILRNLSNQIKEVTYSEEAGIQHLLRIALGALAGIMVGWFAPSGTTSFIGSVSPLAIAFIVGYNIELFFSLMDAVINQVKRLQNPASPAKEDQTANSQINANKSTPVVKSRKKPLSESTRSTASTRSGTAKK